jgi:predicted house-cleaning noncanonical NTP pyrophosphatase (MazG superfamily)
MKKIYYHKLIRDKIPENIRKKGSDCLTYILPKPDFIRELLRKVGEESSALPRISEKKELIKELADIQDVIEEIKRVKNISEQEIKSAQREAHKTKGGFSKRQFLVWSSDDGYKTNEH